MCKIVYALKGWEESSLALQRRAVMRSVFLLRSTRMRLLIGGECRECKVGEFCTLI